MPEEFTSLEFSLKEYIAEANSRGRSSSTEILYKYNNLKIFMNPKQSEMPHLIVRIGISEAMFSLSSGDKISGGLGPDEGTVKRWLARNLSNYDLNNVWKQEKKAKPVIAKED